MISHSQIFDLARFTRAIRKSVIAFDDPIDEWAAPLKIFINETSQEEIIF